MVSFFGKKPAGNTLVVLDVESGSVGGSLIELARRGVPRMIAERREAASIPKVIDSGSLMKETLRLSQRITIALSEVVAGMRQNGVAVAPVSRVVVLLGAPWAHVQILSHTEHTAGAPKPLTETIRRQCYAAFGDIPVEFQAFASAAVSVFGDLGQESLLAVIGGEVTELLVPRDRALRARATIPVGSNTVLRTLGTHAGIHPHEARSALKLTTLHGEEPFTPAAAHFAKQFADAVKNIQPHAPARDIVVIAREPFGEWHARALVAHPTLAELFEEGGVVRALRPGHFKGLIESETSNPDLILTIGALYAGSFNAI